VALGPRGRRGSVKSGEAGGGADRGRGGAVSMGHQGSVCGQFWGLQGTGEITRQR
jgi:hypothetical protein